MTLPIHTVGPTVSDKAVYNKIIKLTCRMLELVPKLRDARSDAERQTVENAVRGTDRAIDEMVYKLYGLTKEEIELVEKATAEKT